MRWLPPASSCACATSVGSSSGRESSPWRIVRPVIPVDVVLAGPGPEELFLARARQETVEEVAVKVASPEDVVAMKVLAGRPKDLHVVPPWRAPLSATA